MDTHAPTHLPAAVRGSLGPKLLRKAPALFDGALATALSEALQNARRAGATRVEATLRPARPGDPALAPGHARRGRDPVLAGFVRPDGSRPPPPAPMVLCLRDDGRGVADFSRLVALGASGWDDAERLDAAEDAAGMGVFSLASRGGCAVRSRGLRVLLTPEVFAGEAEAPVLPDPDPISVGTEVAFPLTHDEARHSLRHALAQAAWYFPLPVSLDGVPLERAGFLDGAVHVAEPWEGLRVGVFRAAHPGAAHACPSKAPAGLAFFVNFFGRVVAAPDALVAVRELGPGGPTWVAAADVLPEGAPGLRLVLPARHAVAEGAFLDALRLRAERALYEWVAAKRRGADGTGGGHSLSRHAMGRAAELGVALPPPVLRLPAWRARDREGRWRDPETEGVRVFVAPGSGPGRRPGGVEADWPVVLVPTGLGNLGEANLAHALEHGAGPPGDLAGAALVREEPGWEGEAAYDALPRLAGLVATLAHADGTAEEIGGGVDEAEPDWEARLDLPATTAGKSWAEEREAAGPLSETRHEVVARITARLLVTRPDGGEGRTTVEAGEASSPMPWFFTAAPDFAELPGVVATRAADPRGLARAVVEGFFSAHEEDADSDAPETQEAAYAEEALALARGLLLGAGEAAAALDGLRGLGWLLRALGEGGRAEVEVARGSAEGRAVVRLRVVAPDGSEAADTLD